MGAIFGLQGSQNDPWEYTFRPKGRPKGYPANEGVDFGAVLRFALDILGPIFAQSTARNARKGTLGRLVPIFVYIFDGFWTVGGPFRAQTGAMNTIIQQNT